MGGRENEDALFVIGEAWLDGSRMGRQRAVQRIESMKGVFGTACCYTSAGSSAGCCGGIGGGELGR
jgi:hypothetical protein